MPEGKEAESVSDDLELGALASSFRAIPSIRKAVAFHLWQLEPLTGRSAFFIYFFLLSNTTNILTIS